LVEEGKLLESLASRDRKETPPPFR
jgi:hypothetical protein